MPYSADEDFDRDSTEWDPAYRSLSPTAVVAMLFGLLSPVVVFGSLMVAAPCLAIALGMLALRRISQSDGALTGRGFALTGLALGVFCLSAWFTQNQTTWLLTHAQAAPMAGEWLDRVKQGDAEGAFLLTLSSQLRGPMTAALSSSERRNSSEQDEGVREDAMKGAEGEDPQSQLRKFRQGPEMTSLLGEGRVSGYRLLGRGPVQRVGQSTTYVTQNYELILKDGSTLTCTLVLERTPPPHAPGQNPPPAFWRVADIQLAESDA